MYQQADAFKSTPAALLGVDDDYAAYCLNEAVHYFGRSVEAAMDKAADKAKNAKAGDAARQKALDRILNPRPGGNNSSGFMDPAGLLK